MFRYISSPLVKVKGKVHRVSFQIVNRFSLKNFKRYMMTTCRLGTHLHNNSTKKVPIFKDLTINRRKSSCSQQLKNDDDDRGGDWCTLFFLEGTQVS